MNKAQIVSIVTSKVAVGVFSALAGVAAGGAGGWFLTKRTLQASFDETFEAALAHEVAQTQEFYARLNKGPGYSTPQEAAETLGVEVTITEKESTLLTDAVVAMTNYAGVTARQDLGDGSVTTKPFEHITMRSSSVIDQALEEPAEVVEEVVARNIFVNGEPLDADDLSDEELFEADTAVIREAETGPYVISFEEFMEAAPGYEQPGLTYFSRDDVLLDDKEEVIEDVEKVISEEALRRFGYKSRNNDIVYVRNPVLELDFEVTRSRNSYASDVLGLRHSSDHHPMRKFRRGDDE